jgi:hypothetical protein
MMSLMLLVRKGYLISGSRVHGNVECSFVGWRCIWESRNRSKERIE